MLGLHLFYFVALAIGTNYLFLLKHKDGNEHKAGRLPFFVQVRIFIFSLKPC